MSSVGVVVSLMLTALSATLEVVIMTSMGYLLVHFKSFKSVEHYVSSLSHLVFTVFTPCMFLSKIARTVTLEMLSRVWILLVFSFIYVGIGFALGLVTFYLPNFIMSLRGSRSNNSTSSTSAAISNNSSSRWLSAIQQRIFILSLAFANSGNLPFVFIAAICKLGTVFKDSKYASDTAIAYVCIYVTPLSILFWSFGLWFFRQGKEITEREEKEQEEAKLGHEHELHTAAESDTKSLILNNDNNQQQQHTAEDEISVVQTQESSANATSEPVLPIENEPAPAKSNKFIAKLKQWFSRENIVTILKRTFTPPCMGMIIGALIAVIPPAKYYLVESPPPILGSFIHIVEIMGDATFAASMLVLGANLYQTVNSEQKPKQNTKQITTTENDEQNHQEEAPRSSLIRRITSKIHSMAKRVVRHSDPIGLVLNLILKLMVMPAIGICITIAVLKLNWMPSNDPILLLVLFVQSSTPSALNLSMFATLSNGYGIAPTTELLLFHYLLAPVTLTLYATVFLYLSCYLTGECSFAL